MKESKLIGISVAIWTTTFLFYAYAGLPLSKTDYYLFYNLAFDFDTQRIFSLLTAPDPDLMGIKHPLLIIFRPIGQALLLLTSDARVATAITMALIGSTTCTGVYYYLLLQNAREDHAVLGAVIFAISTTQIILSITPESYGFAALSIVCTWTVAAACLRNKLKRLGAIIVTGIITIGITPTNFLQTILSTLTLITEKNRAIFTPKLVTRALALTITIFIACFSIIWWEWIANFLANPVMTLKKIWWEQTFGEKVGITQLLKTYAIYSFFAPDFTTIPLPEGTLMLDFRDWRMSTLGNLGALAWSCIIMFGLGSAFLHRDKIAISMIIAISLNLIFHLFYQYRGSVFIYSGHLHFLVLGVSLSFLGKLNSKSSKNFVTALLTVTAMAMMVNNASVLHDFAEKFSPANTSCPAPCN